MKEAISREEEGEVDNIGNTLGSLLHTSSSRNGIEVYLSTGQSKRAKGWETE